MPELVEFVDTSVLLVYLDVPHMNAGRQAIVSEMKRKQKLGVLFILPVAAVVEAGNHIAQVANGDARRRCARALEAVLRLSVQQTTPWTVHAAAWDEAFLTSLCDGVAGRMPSMLETMTTGQLGTGDLSILAERERYRQRVAVYEVGIWTLDERLKSWA